MGQAIQDQEVQLRIHLFLLAHSQEEIQDGLQPQRRRESFRNDQQVRPGVPHEHLYLLKAILAEDIDKMEQLGIYEVVEEDFALCEYIDPSKIDIQAIVSKGIDLMIKEMA